MKQILLTIVLLIIAVVIFFWPESELEISRLNQVSSEQASRATKSAQNAYATFRKGGMSKLKPLMIKMDNIGYSDLRNTLAQFREPKFDNASVVSPQFNKKLFYVNVTDNKKKFIFVMKLQSRHMLLSSIGLQKL